MMWQSRKITDRVWRTTRWTRRSRCYTQTELMGELEGRGGFESELLFSVDTA